MKTLVELFDACNHSNLYTKVKTEDGRFEVDYRFIENSRQGILYVLFEPSEGKIDWVVNFAYARKPYKDMKIGYKVHGGFLESWRLVKDAIGTKVKQKGADGAYKWKKVVVAGYSHGGALAALCHEFVWYEREDLRANGLVGYSFDGPRVYAGFWVKKELKERWRTFTVFRNQNDIVTHLPPQLFGFRHVGTIRTIGKSLEKCGPIGAHYPDKIRAALAVEDGRK